MSRNNLWQTRPYPAYFTTPNAHGRNFCVRDFHPSDFDQDFDLHNGIVDPPASAGPNTRHAEPVFRVGHGGGGRVQLAEGTPGHDDGVRLANVNDRFLGAAPDRGAHEAGSPDLQFGAVLWRRMRAEAPVR